MFWMCCILEKMWGFVDDPARPLSHISVMFPLFSPWPTGTCPSSRSSMSAAVSWWTEYRITSKVKSCTTSWTSTSTPTPSTSVGTERPITTRRDASGETLSCQTGGNRCFNKSSHSNSSDISKDGGFSKTLEWIATLQLASWPVSVSSVFPSGFCFSSYTELNICCL